MVKSKRYRKKKCKCLKKCRIKTTLKKCCKKCVKNKCPCIKRKSRKKSRKKSRRSRSRKNKTKRRRYRSRKQRGGNRACHMGEVFTGYGINNYNLKGSLYPVSTQDHVPKMSGGGLFSQRAIDFGLGNALTFTRDGVNHLTNLKQTWNGDRHVDSADPVIAGKDFNKE